MIPSSSRSIRRFATEIWQIWFGLDAVWLCMSFFGVSNQSASLSGGQRVSGALLARACTPSASHLYPLLIAAGDDIISHTSTQFHTPRVGHLTRKPVLFWDVVSIHEWSIFKPP